jgi:anionic cell wall polymer biosynthesis LytR-Cps2A-Psr (LCP) family protein
VRRLELEKQNIGPRMRRRLESRKKRRKLFIIFFSLVVISLLIYLIFYILRPGEKIAEEPTVISEEETTGEIKEEVVFTGRKNFLIIGSDHSLEQISPNSVVLISYNSSSEEALLLSIPLRTLLQSDDEAMTVEKLLREFQVEDLKSAIKNTLAIEIDNCVLVNVFDLLEKIGGISVYIPENISFPDVDSNVTVTLEKGERNLTGDLTISYLHYTSGESESILQVSDQQDIYLSILDKLMADKDFSEIANEMQLISEYISSDFSDVELISLGSSIVKLEESKIFKNKTLPVLATKIDGENHYVPQIEETARILSEFTTVADIEEREKSNIIVLNGCGSPGIAHNLSNKLQQDFQIVEIGNAASFQYTMSEIIVTSFNINVIEDAISIRNNMGVGEIITDGGLTEETKQKTDIVIIIGSDYIPL